MKTLIYLFIALWMSTFPLSATSQGDVPPPPDNHGQSGNQEAGDGNGATIGGGVFILLALGMAYGGKKYLDYRKKLRNEVKE